MPDNHDSQVASSHEHTWQSAATYSITDQKGATLLVLALFCPSCAAVCSKIVPPPELSPIVQAKPALVGINNR